MGHRPIYTECKHCKLPIALLQSTFNGQWYAYREGAIHRCRLSPVDPRQKLLPFRNRSALG